MTASKDTAASTDSGYLEVEIVGEPDQTVISLVRNGVQGVVKEGGMLEFALDDGDTFRLKSPEALDVGTEVYIRRFQKEEYCKPLSEIGDNPPQETRP
jgi:hypothetical protein